MERIRFLQVDAFASRPFAGNPAAVCFLQRARNDEWMQAVAAEMHLSETAFLLERDKGFDLRWFTPTVEVDLCGHATLASAHALWSTGMAPGEEEPIRFHTRSGILVCLRRGESIEMDFPATPPHKVEPPPGLLEALGVQPTWVGRSKFDNFLIIEDESVVRALEPDFSRLREIPIGGVIVTSSCGDRQFDFVSRYFAPAAGIDEDPVTGSAHCCLGPFWSERLGKKDLTGFQASRRGGVVTVRVADDRVMLGGQAVTILDGYLVADDCAM